MQWVLTPADERQPKTPEMLSAELNLHPSTLKRWFNHPGFKLALQAIIRYQIQFQIAFAYYALIQTARQGDIRSIIILIDILNMVTPSPKIKVSRRKDLQSFTPEEIRQARKNIKDWEEREFGISQQNELD